jgi:hypothetical protein
VEAFEDIDVKVLEQVAKGDMVEAFIAGMSASLDGVHTAHQMFLILDEEWLTDPSQRGSVCPRIDDDAGNRSAVASR